MRKILIICGPTATGKTQTALRLAKKFSARGGADILSADSRQVYKGMGIVTGKDLPVDSKLKTPRPRQAKRGWQNSKLEYWETPGGVRIWLTDLVNPKEKFSVSGWIHAAEILLRHIQRENRLPIIVGATGFYISTLLDGVGTLNIPPDEKLRKKLRNRKTKELFEMLQKIDYQHAVILNKSDRKNPRRLIRAIEIANRYRTKGEQPALFGGLSKKYDCFIVGLFAPRQFLNRIIDARVEERIKEGAIDETKKLLESGVSLNNESMTGTGYRYLVSYLEGKMAKKEAIGKWKMAEHKDAKKQFTWFKRDKRIKWFDITNPNWYTEVEKLVENWYSKK